MLSPNARRRIAGKLPLKREIVDWGSGKLLAFLQFVDFFTEGDKFDMSVPNIEAAKRRALEEDFWDEFVARIDAEGTMTAGHFAKRFYSMSRVPLSWLKSNPHAVTAEMFSIMEKNPRMQWAACAFKAVETEMGVQIVLRDQSETLDPGASSNSTHAGDVQTPAVKFEQAKMALITTMNMLVKGLSPQEIAKMSAKDRIASFDKLLNTGLKIMGANRPAVQIFNAINVHKTGRDELERAVLGYSESQQTE
jgi:hypothetical protein